MIHDRECSGTCKKCNNDQCMFMDIACDDEHKCWSCYDKECWYIYIVRCNDGTLYTGIAKDLNKRIDQHNNGKGAKYTRGRGPVTLVNHFRRHGKSEALKLERKIKLLSKEEKLSLDDVHSRLL